MTSIFTTLSPNWNIPNVKAYTILSEDIDSNEVSFSRYDPLGTKCREQLEQLVKPVYPIHWLRQVHGSRIVEMPVRACLAFDCLSEIEADGAFTSQKGVVCAILTADCLPIVFANQSGTKVGVVHAGRKGLEYGIISEMIKTLGVAAHELYVWIGPGISAESYLISKEIRDEFMLISSVYESVFTECGSGQFLMNLYEVAKIQLVTHGITKENIDGAAWNTFTDKRFHSARRDKDQSGRMATVVWME